MESNNDISEQLEPVEKRLATMVEHVLAETKAIEKREKRRDERHLEFLLARPEYMRELVRSFWVRLSPGVMKPQPWTIIEVGTAKDERDVFKTEPGVSVDSLYFRSDSSHERAFVEWELQNEKKSIGLIQLSGWDLGFRDPISYTELCNRAKIFGFNRCPHETPFQLVRQCREATIAARRLLFACKPAPHYIQVSRSTYQGWGFKLPILASLKQERGYVVDIKTVDCNYKLKSPKRKYVFECPLIESQ